MKAEKFKDSEQLLILIDKHFPAYIKYRDLLYLAPFTIYVVFTIYPSVAILLVLIVIFFVAIIYIYNVKAPKEFFEAFIKNDTLPLYLVDRLKKLLLEGTNTLPCTSF